MAIVNLPVGGRVEIRVSPPSKPGKLVYRGDLRRRGKGAPVCTKFTTAFDSDKPVTFLLDHPIDFYTITITASTPGSKSVRCAVTAQGFKPSGAKHDDKETRTMTVKPGNVANEVTFNVSLAPAA